MVANFFGKVFDEQFFLTKDESDRGYRTDAVVLVASHSRKILHEVLHSSDTIFSISRGIHNRMAHMWPPLHQERYAV